MDTKQKPRIRRHHTRSKSGCLTCRFRRKRCGEEKPICIGCRRNSLICSWPSAIAQSLASSYETPRKQVVVEAETPLPGPIQELPIDDLDFDPFVAYPLENDCITVSDGGSVHSFDGPTTTEASEDVDECISRVYKSLSFHPKTLSSPGAPQLLQYYVESTAFALATRPFPGNPYASCLLPLALADDNIMHALLATSGSHRACSTEDETLYPLARQHYAVALRSAKYQITKFVQGQFEQPYLLIALLLSLCQFECVDGDLNGAVLHHLGAASQILARAPPATAIDRACYSFLLEQAAYLSCVSKNVGLGLGIEDPSVVALPPLQFLELFGTEADDHVRGFMIGYAYELYRLIPQIKRLAVIQHSGAGDSEETTLAAFEAIRTTLTLWQPQSQSGKPQSTTLRAAGLMYQQAIFIYLYCAVHGPSKPTRLLFFQLDPHINQFIKIMDQLPSDSPEWTSMMWPMITVGSCIRDPNTQEHFALSMHKFVHRMYAIPSTLKILRWIWDSGASEAYGPYGIDKMMKQHRVTLSLG